MPRNEPNSYGEMNGDEWRATYEAYATEFKTSRKALADELHLRQCLKRLGYLGALLESEIEHLKSN